MYWQNCVFIFVLGQRPANEFINYEYLHDTRVMCCEIWRAFVYKVLCVFSPVPVESRGYRIRKIVCTSFIFFVTTTIVFLASMNAIVVRQEDFLGGFFIVRNERERRANIDDRARLLSRTTNSRGFKQFSKIYSKWKFSVLEFFTELIFYTRTIAGIIGDWTTFTMFFHKLFLFFLEKSTRNFFFFLAFSQWNQSNFFSIFLSKNWPKKFLFLIISRKIAQK